MSGPQWCLQAGGFLQAATGVLARSGLTLPGAVGRYLEERGASPSVPLFRSLPC